MYGLNESLLASAIAAIGFAVFAVQPLTIVGITGLISLVSFIFCLHFATDASSQFNYTT